MDGTSPMKLCVRSSLIFSAPGFNHNLGFLQGQKPVLGQALTPKLAVETLNKCILDRLPRLDEMQRDPMLIGPRVQGVPCELRSIVQLKTSCMDRLAKTRSRIRQTRSPPIKPSISITGHLFRVRIGHRQALEPPAIG